LINGSSEISAEDKQKERKKDRNGLMVSGITLLLLLCIIAKVKASCKLLVASCTFVYHESDRCNSQ